jgi:uncharacterized protein
MDGPGYPRNIQAALDLALADTPVVAVLGPRQCGKTTLVRALAPGRAYYSLDEDPLLATARSDPGGFIAALPSPVTIDEVQRAPELFRAIKLAVDRDRRPGRFLLTGSAHLLLMPEIGDSLAGRIEIVQLHPLTESEKNRKGGTLLGAFLEDGLAQRLSTAEGNPGGELMRRVLEGGYPPALTRSTARATQWHRQYIDRIIERDVPDIARVRGAHELGKLLELVAHRSAQLLNLTALGAELGMRRETCDEYLRVLEKLFLLRRLPAWHRNEASRLIKTPKVHLLDSGLASALAGLEADDWIARRDRVGPFLESFVVQQLVAQGGWTQGGLRFWHYRDKDQVEVDLVITRGRRTWAVEVKAGMTVTAADGQGLRRLAERCGKDFQGGMILYAGASILRTTDPRILAVPLAELWTR